LNNHAVRNAEDIRPLHRPQEVFNTQSNSWTRLAITRHEMRLFLPSFPFIRPTTIDFLFCSTLPDSMMDFAEPPVGEDRRSSRNQLSHLESPAQRTAIHLIEQGAGKVALQISCLPAANGIHRDVELTLKSPFDVPVRLPMSYQNQSSFPLPHRPK